MFIPGFYFSWQMLRPYYLDWSWRSKMISVFGVFNQKEQTHKHNRIKPAMCTYVSMW